MRRLASVFNSQQLEKADEEALEALKDAGVTVSELTPEDFKAAGQAFYEDPQIKAMWSEAYRGNEGTIGRQD
ncbi:MAG: hypothetical protein ACLTW9_08920 [Enterocloster sp.]